MPARARARRVLTLLVATIITAFAPLAAAAYPFEFYRERKAYGKLESGGKVKTLG